MGGLTRRVHALLVCGAALGAIGGGCANADLVVADQTDDHTTCGNSTAVAGRPIRIVTTVAPITSIVAAIVGDAGAEVVGMIPEGENSHTFAPSPSAVEALERADVVFINGLFLEEPTKALGEANIGGDGEICELANAVLSEDQWIYDFSFPKDGGRPNPHLWTDPTLVEKYADVILDVMSRRDPAQAATYRVNHGDFIARIDVLDAAIRVATTTVPPAHRKLLTFHDGFAYFARTYGWDVIGAMQPSSFSEPTPRDVVDLIAQVNDLGVPAVFGSEVFPSPVLAQIGREAGVRYVDVLRDDDLPGGPGDVDHSWLGLIRFDVVTMIEALGGDASALRALDLDLVATDGAFYPQ